MVDTAWPPGFSFVDFVLDLFAPSNWMQHGADATRLIHMTCALNATEGFCILRCVVRHCTGFFSSSISEFARQPPKANHSFGRTRGPLVGT